MKEDIVTRLIYPDPFKPAGLEFILPAEAVVTVTVTNQEGELILTLLNDKKLPSGRHEVEVPSRIAMRQDNYINLSIEMGGECIRVVKKM